MIYLLVAISLGTIGTIISTCAFIVALWRNVQHQNRAGRISGKHWINKHWSRTGNKPHP